jgi:hypothetical protein
MQVLEGIQATKTPEYLIYENNHYNVVWYNTKTQTKGNNKIKRKKQNTQTKNKN